MSFRDALAGLFDPVWRSAAQRRAHAERERQARDIAAWNAAVEAKKKARRGPAR